MTSQARWVWLLVGFALGAVMGGIAGVFIYLRIVGGTGEPSTPISAPTLSLERSSDTPAPFEAATQAAQFAAVSTQIAALSTAIAENAASNQAAVNGLRAQVSALDEAVSRFGTPAATRTRTPVPTFTPSPTRTPVPTLTPSQTALPNQTLFRIVPEESEARFILDELDPFVMGLVGSTNQVAGDILVDFDQPQNSRLGVIRINLRTLRTDNSSRDQAIRGEVLLSARPEYEFTDFTPTAITGLPENITFGEPVTFQITGDLPFRGIMRSVTFETTVTVISETELRGLARTTILRRDYGMLQGFLTERGVSDEIILELEFVARAVE